MKSPSVPACPCSCIRNCHGDVQQCFDVTNAKHQVVGNNHWRQVGHGINMLSEVIVVWRIVGKGCE